MAARYETQDAFSSDGTRLSVRVHGRRTAPAIVLIHGYCCSQLAFSRQVDSALTDKYRLVTYDVRGHGQSEKPDEPARYSRNKLWSDDLDAVLDALDLRSAVLVGWSMGGRIAANYLYTHGSNRIRGVNFVSTPAFADPKTAFRGPEGAISQQTLSPRWEELIIGTARFIRACTAVASTGEDFDLMMGAAMVVPMVARQGSYQWHIDYGDAMRGFDIPVLATHGGSDRLILPVAAQAIAHRMQNVELSIYPEAGHMPFFESPSRFNAELDAFAARCYAA
ncbi:MAG TPA: alpha/beta hydrolase [Steroidobacteraceae bacterium]|jgi:pimeloyl-ACP methyl ester carboxylesterase|nr:alpha/beta hydrolase [Steroidobacteraceae bacterium]